MTELDFLRDLVVLFGASIAVVYGFNRLRLPAVVGFLGAGALLGPYGLDVVDDVARVEVFAEVGVVLLLFTIGVEFSLGQLRSLRTVASAFFFSSRRRHTISDRDWSSDVCSSD